MKTPLSHLARHLAGMAARISRTAKKLTTAPRRRRARRTCEPTPLVEPEDVVLSQLLAATVTPTAFDDAIDMSGMSKEALRAW